MPAHEDAYNAELDKARRILREMVRNNVGDLAKRYALLLIAIDKAFPKTGVIDEAGAGRVLKKIRILMAGYSRDLQRVLLSAVDTSINLAIQAHVNGYREAAEKAGVAAAGIALIGGIFSKVTNFARRRRGPFVNVTTRLVRQRTTEAFHGVDDFIRRNEGRPYRDIGNELLDGLSGHSEVQNAIKNLGQRGESVRRAINRASRHAPGGHTGLYSNGRRILFHEVNAMYHEADALASHESPAVEALQWHTSEWHPQASTTPDICDVIEHTDTHGLGEGVYFPGSAPTLPHPHCQDYTTKIFRKPTDWHKPKTQPTKPPGGISTKQIEDILRKYGGGKTQGLSAGRITQISENVNRNIQVAHDAFVDF